MPEHKISVETDKDLMIVYQSGFWQMDDFKAIIAEEHAARAQLKCTTGKHLLLCDLTDLKVVAPDVAQKISATLNGQGPQDAEWIAIAVKSVLLNLQFQRLLTRSKAAIFDNVADARKWLLSSAGQQPTS